MYITIIFFSYIWAIFIHYEAKESFAYGIDTKRSKRKRTNENEVRNEEKEVRETRSSTEEKLVLGIGWRGEFVVFVDITRTTWICSVNNGFWLWLVLLVLIELLLFQLECTYVLSHLLKDGEQALGRFLLLQVVQICVDIANVLIQDMTIF